MSAEFESCLRRYAGVIVRVGLDLQPGQRLLIAEPYELQGVAREAALLVDAVTIAAQAAGAGDVSVIWGDEARLRAAGESWPHREFSARIADDTARLRRAAEAGEAILFLPSTHPRLLDGIAPAQAAALREHCWKEYGPVAQLLVAGRTNWTAAPAPTATWAAAVFASKAEPGALELLWRVVFAACRADCADPIAAWQEHLALLEARRLELNGRRAKALRFRGAGTDLTVALAPGHVWSTSVRRTHDGRSFVANLPTEEVFTAPDRDAVEGTLRVARPVAYGGAVIDGVELAFRRGRVVQARARQGEELLNRLLATDPGASRLGEVALVPRRNPALATAGACFHQALLDENALDHVALGESYPFTVRHAGSRALNHSLIHLDLPLDAEARLVFA